MIGTDRMRCESTSGHLLLVVATACTLLSCAGGGPEVVTSITFDGEPRTITTRDVSCVRQPDDSVVILVSDGRRRMVRLHIGRHRQITVFKAGFRHDDLRGFVADPDAVVGTRVDDTYTVRGRVPPNDGEREGHTFSIETSCPRYRDATPNDTVPALGVP